LAEVGRYYDSANVPVTVQNHDPVRLNWNMILISLFEHDLFKKKPVPVFPDHASDVQRLFGDFGSVGRGSVRRARIRCRGPLAAGCSWRNHIG
jgi:hypothetical protein